MEVLTELQLEQFRTKGFLHLARFIAPEEVTALERETEDLHEQMASNAVAEGHSPSTGHSARLKNGAHVSWKEVTDAQHCETEDLPDQMASYAQSPRASSDRSPAPAAACSPVRN